MSFTTFYRIMVWVPLAVPGAVVALVSAAEWRVPPGPLAMLYQLLVGSLLIGGVPYLALALWATGWIPRHTEPEIRRLAIQAPLLMLAAYAVVPVFYGVVSRDLGVIGGMVLLGVGAIPMLGYAYVGLALAARRLLFGRFHQPA